MNFYTQQHKHYCGIDLHAKAMYVCILDQQGTKLVHKNLPTTPAAFLRAPCPVSGRRGRRRGMYVHVVLGGGLVSEGRDCLCLRPRLLYEGDSWGQSQER